MADSKITALTALTAADPVNDMFPVVDVSDTTMAASGTTKKISVNNLLSSSPTASGALTVTGLVTAGSATITGAATVGTTLGVTGAISGASLALSGAGAAFTATATSGNSLNQISRPTNATAAGIQLKTSSTNDWIFGLRETSDSDFHLFSYGTVTDVLTVARSTGNVNIIAGNVVMTTSGKGIDFSAVTGGTGTATGNVLNDYEEGTWVPTQGSGLTVVGAFSSSGTYTKVGRLVTINGVVTGATSVAVGATSVLCAGLPFSATNQATATAVNASFNASAFCAIDTVSFYAITSMVATTSIRFTATYYV